MMRPSEIKYGENILHFDESAHTYFLQRPGQDAIPLKSTTQYLKEAGYCHLWHGNGEAATKGRFVHEATLFDDAGDLDDATLDPNLTGYVEAWRRFKTEKQFVPQLDLCERPCFDPIYLVGGTPDTPGTLAGELAVIEKKTGAACPWHALQAVSYTQMLGRHYEAWKQARTAIVYLRDDGSYTFQEVTDKKLPMLFASLVATVNGKEFYGDRNGRVSNEHHD